MFFQKFFITGRFFPTRNGLNICKKKKIVVTIGTISIVISIVEPIRVDSRKENFFSGDGISSRHRRQIKIFGPDSGHLKARKL